MPLRMPGAWWVAVGRAVGGVAGGGAQRAVAGVAAATQRAAVQQAVSVQATWAVAERIAAASGGVGESRSGVWGRCELE